MLVGAGDPERQIPGIRDVLWGEAGARKAWDEEAIRTQHDVALQSTVRAATLRTQIAAATADQDRLCRAPLEIPIPESDPLPPVISETLSVDASILAGMSQRELIQRVLTITAESAGMAHREHERTRDVIAAATAAADQRMRDLHGLAAEITRLTHSQRESERSAERAELSLEKLRLGGPTRPIADADPTTAELRTLTGDRAIRARDDETWDALLERVGTECSTAEAGRLRAWLNHREVLAITGLPARTLQRYRLGESSHPLALGIQRADWVELGDKLFFVHADTLPLHLFLPTQLPGFSANCFHSRWDLCTAVGGEPTLRLRRSGCRERTFILRPSSWMLTPLSVVSFDDIEARYPSRGLTGEPSYSASGGCCSTSCFVRAS